MLLGDLVFLSQRFNVFVLGGWLFYVLQRSKQSFTDVQFRAHLEKQGVDCG